MESCTVDLVSLQNKRCYFELLLPVRQQTRTQMRHQSSTEQLYCQEQTADRTEGSGTGRVRTRQEGRQTGKRWKAIRTTNDDLAGSWRNSRN